jgi:hypothetical protein
MVNPVLADAIERALIGGNHLALLIGVDHPPYTAEPDEALEHYGAGETYDIWCAWRALMRLSRVWDAFREHDQA